MAAFTWGRTSRGRSRSRRPFSEHVGRHSRELPRQRPLASRRYRGLRGRTPERRLHTAVVIRHAVRSVVFHGASAAGMGGAGFSTPVINAGDPGMTTGSGF